MVPCEDVRHDFVDVLAFDFVLLESKEGADVFGGSEDFSGPTSQVYLDGSVNWVKYISGFFVVGLRILICLRLIDFLVSLNFRLDFGQFFGVLIEVLVKNKTGR